MKASAQRVFSGNLGQRIVFIGEFVPKGEKPDADKMALSDKELGTLRAVARAVAEAIAATMSSMSAGVGLSSLLLSVSTFSNTLASYGTTSGQGAQAKTLRQDARDIQLSMTRALSHITGIDAQSTVLKQVFSASIGQLKGMDPKGAEGRRVSRIVTVRTELALSRIASPDFAPSGTNVLAFVASAATPRSDTQPSVKNVPAGTASSSEALQGTSHPFADGSFHSAAQTPLQSFQHQTSVPVPAVSAPFVDQGQPLSVQAAPSIVPNGATATAPTSFQSSPSSPSLPAATLLPQTAMPLAFQQAPAFVFSSGLAVPVDAFQQMVVAIVPQTIQAAGVTAPSAPSYVAPALVPATLAGALAPVFEAQHQPAFSITAPAPSISLSPTPGLPPTPPQTAAHPAPSVPPVQIQETVSAPLAQPIQPLPSQPTAESRPVTPVQATAVPLTSVTSPAPQDLAATGPLFGPVTSTPALTPALSPQGVQAAAPPAATPNETVRNPAPSYTPAAGAVLLSNAHAEISMQRQERGHLNDIGPVQPQPVSQKSAAGGPIERTVEAQSPEIVGRDVAHEAPRRTDPYLDRRPPEEEPVRRIRSAGSGAGYAEEKRLEAKPDTTSPKPVTPNPKFGVADDFLFGHKIVGDARSHVSGSRGSSIKTDFKKAATGACAGCSSGNCAACSRPSISADTQAMAHRLAL